MRGGGFYYAQGNWHLHTLNGQSDRRTKRETEMWTTDRKKTGINETTIRNGRKERHRVAQKVLQDDRKTDSMTERQTV